jgi:hypothetical protein
VKTLIALAVLLVPSLAACSSSSSSSPSDAGGTCTFVVQYDDADTAVCDKPIPSYQTDVLPILQSDCIVCHSPTGTAGYDETSYTDVYNQLSPIFSQVATCEMPPLNGPELSNAQRTTLIDWLACGAPNN